MESRARVFVSLKTLNMQGALKTLKEKYPLVRLEEDFIRVYDVDKTEEIVEYLIQKGFVVNQIEKNKIGLEEYYIEIMSQKEEK
jgi:hypothetical protein